MAIASEEPDGNHRPIVVLGSVNIDLVSRTPRLPQAGETVHGGEYYRAQGGKGANQAVAAARLCQDSVRFIAAVGNDEFGRAAVDSFKAEGLDCRYVQPQPDTATGVALILVDHEGRNLISVASGANAKLGPQAVAAIPEEDFRGQLLLTCLESPTATVLAALERARSLGMKTLLNPAPADAALEDSALLDHVDILTPNQNEAALLTGLEIDSTESAITAARRLQDGGVPTIILTRGREGLLICEKEVHILPAHRVESLDTTAAGDAFNGALAAGLAQGRSLLDACGWAQAAAALSVTRRGAQPSLPRRREVEDFLAERSPGPML